jgi:hypothetical protein
VPIVYFEAVVINTAEMVGGLNWLLQKSCKFGQALFKLGEINEDEDSVAAYDSLRARNRSGSPAKSIGDKYYGSFYWQFFQYVIRNSPHNGGIPFTEFLRYS